VTSSSRLNYTSSRDVTFKVQADRVAILPHRVAQVIMDTPHSHQQPAEQYASGPGASQEGYGE